MGYFTGRSHCAAGCSRCAHAALASIGSRRGGGRSATSQRRYVAAASPALAGAMLAGAVGVTASPAQAQTLPAQPAQAEPAQAVPVPAQPPVPPPPVPPPPPPPPDTTVEGAVGLGVPVYGVPLGGEIAIDYFPETNEIQFSVLLGAYTGGKASVEVRPAREPGVGTEAKVTRQVGPYTVEFVLNSRGESGGDLGGNWKVNLGGVTLGGTMEIYPNPSLEERGGTQMPIPSDARAVPHPQWGLAAAAAAGFRFTSPRIDLDDVAPYIQAIYAANGVLIPPEYWPRQDPSAPPPADPWGSWLMSLPDLFGSLDWDQVMQDMNGPVLLDPERFQDDAPAEPASTAQPASYTYDEGSASDTDVEDMTAFDEYESEDEDFEEEMPDEDFEGEESVPEDDFEDEVEGENESVPEDDFEEDVAPEDDFEEDVPDDDAEGNEDSVPEEDFEDDDAEGDEDSVPEDDGGEDRQPEPEPPSEPEPEPEPDPEPAPEPAPNPEPEPGPAPDPEDQSVPVPDAEPEPGPPSAPEPHLEKGEPPDLGEGNLLPDDTDVLA
jgi:hypothetical protein